MTILYKHSLIAVAISVAGLAGGCSSVSLVQPVVPAPVLASRVVPNGIESAQRALPTLIGNSTQPAHYDHVYIDSKDAAARSLKTITLDDAIAHDVLASNPLPVVRQEIDPDKLKWLTFNKADRRPTSLEGVGGYGVGDGNYVEVNFDTDKTEILNKDKVLPLIKKASRVTGFFYVVGYADETGIEAKNKTLSQNRAISVKDLLTAANIHESRIHDSGAGVSRTYPDLASNRRTSISFKVDGDQ
ncbi:OmpA family protein [Rhodoferax antarcticus]|nr:OmpA family protein [Rhodoferax antarcticus]